MIREPVPVSPQDTPEPRSSHRSARTLSHPVGTGFGQQDASARSCRPRAAVRPFGSPFDSPSAEREQTFACWALGETNLRSGPARRRMAVYNSAASGGIHISATLLSGVMPEVRRRRGGQQCADYHFPQAMYEGSLPERSQAAGKRPLARAAQLCHLLPQLKYLNYQISRFSLAPPILGLKKQSPHL
jgi:hypothetical protein